MSFSSEVKNELCGVAIDSPEAALAESYGVLLFCSQCSSDVVRIITESEPFAQRIPTIFQMAFQLTFDRVPDKIHPGRMVFEITDSNKLMQLFDRCGYNSRQMISMHINFGMMETEQTRLAFLRGAFLAGGSVTDPEKRYHMEFATSHLSVSREVLSILEECGFQGKTTTRKGNYLLYFKQGSEIAQLLTALGAPEAGRQLNAARALKISVNKANRRSNCDLANVDKTVTAARAQLTAIRYLEENKLFDTLPDKLKEAAILRRDNPELNLAQLGELCNPPVTKSSFNHRLKKLMSLCPD